MHRAQPSLVSLEAEGWAVVSSGWGWEPVSSLRLVCPSGRQNPNHPERSLCPAGTGPIVCPRHVAGGVREGSERVVLVYLTMSPPSGGDRQSVSSLT